MRSALNWRRARALLLATAALCSAPPAGAKPFAFVLLADPHLGGRLERVRRLERAVSWIIANRDEHGFELVFVLGDLAWGGSGTTRNLAVAKKVLDPLNAAVVPYVPVLGDNEVQANCEHEFVSTFAPQYEILTRTTTDFQHEPAPETGGALQNFSFDYKGFHFVCPDFISREKNNEGGDLHPGPGGSWQWFQADIANCPKPKRENIVILTHIGMFQTHLPLVDRFLFSSSSMTTIREGLRPWRQNVAANYAGHIHQNFHAIVWDGLLSPLYHVWVTDETWNDPPQLDHTLTVRWVRVDTSGAAVTYEQHVVDIDAVP